jgi:hypothetical protein
MAADQDGVEVMKAGLTLTEVADLARAAINQRHAGLEMHPETLAHSQSPILCDIRSIVLASSCLPSFIFDNLKPWGSDENQWAGYMLFGSAYTPRCHRQNILALPANSICRPIEEWWKVTHEIGHAVFEVLRVMQKTTPSFQAYVAEMYGEPNARRVLGEFFANWFDWKYVFRRDTEYFTKRVWESWLSSVPVIWEQKAQYLVRSFAIYLCEGLPALVAAWQSGREIDHLMPLLRERWQRFLQLVGGVAGMEKYLSAVSEEAVVDVLDHVRGVLPILTFFERSFESVCGVASLYERLDPAYPSVAAHVESILQGRIVTEAIPNPCKLHVELMKALRGQPPLQAEIAYILSLENHYVTAVLPLNEV